MLANIKTSIVKSRKLNYIFVGGASTVIENLSLIFFLDLGLNFLSSRFFAGIFTLIFSYAANTYLTFKSTHDWKRLGKYSVGVIVAASLSYLFSLIFFYVLLNQRHPLLAINVGAAAAALINYLYQSKITYKV